MRTFRNPIIPGYNPDPSICRAGDTFYIVNSTNEYFPGVSVYSSKNLTDWKMIGHCFTRDSQLNLEGMVSSDGIYAPTIRYHDGVFFMVTTIADSRSNTAVNIIVHTQDPAGEWSEPVVMPQMGIDPSLLFDGDKVYFISMADCQGNGGLFASEINPFTGELYTPCRPLTTGSGGFCREAPHLYHIGDYYYLTTAEGGTENRQHCVTMMRSRELYGPYEACPHNPILCNVNIGGPDTLACTGHGDLVEDQNGNWWMVCLGVRFLPYHQGTLPLHNLGRETLLTPVTWKDGWALGGTDGTLRTEITADLPGEAEDPEGTVRAKVMEENFRGKTWDPRFTHIRNPIRDRYVLDPQAGSLTLTGGDLLSKVQGNPTFLGTRQTEFCQTVSVTVSGEACREDSFAGLSAFYAADQHYEVGIGLRQGKMHVIVRRQIYDLVKEDVYGEVEGDQVRIGIAAGNEFYTFRYWDAQGNPVDLNTGAAAGLCTEICRTRVSFTGTFLGMFAENMTASFRNFRVENN